MAKQGQGDQSLWGKRYGTPQFFLERLQERYGAFNLDCAAEAATAKCDWWFGPDHPDPDFRNALRRDWDVHGGKHTRGFLNWPYGQTENLIWTRKAWHQSRDRNIEVVGLGPSNSTDTFWWHHVAMKAEEICYVEGRISFELDGIPQEKNALCNAVFLWRNHNLSRPRLGPSFDAKP